MLQVLQDLSSGETRSAEVPAPVVASGCLLIRNRASVVSSGTERMLVEFGRANLLQKALSQPEKVRQALQKVRTDGVTATVVSIRAKLSRPMPLGYSCAGEVIGVGAGVEGFEVGDRVVSNGPHAGVVLVPKHLCARIPEPHGGRSEEVSFDEAAFAVLGSIGLQGIRLAEPTLGEVFVVTGLGIIGLLTAQILKAHGCRVLALDFDDSRVDLARSLGVEAVDLSVLADPESVVRKMSGGLGADGVIIAAATDGNEPVRQAARLCRKRGRIVLVGVTGLDLVRQDFYEKELTFQVSCSYGPGRYDTQYEELGHDYPAAFVRWTEQRNFVAVLDLMASGSLDALPLISHRFPVENAVEAYDLIAADRDHLAIVLEYGEEASETSTEIQISEMRIRGEGKIRLGWIGSGEFSAKTLAPAFLSHDVAPVVAVSQRGASAQYLARTAGFDRMAADAETVFTASDVNVVVIATQHDSHADLAARALRGGKHVYLEKPLAINFTQLERLREAVKNSEALLHVGYNRRWAPLIVELKHWLSRVGESFHMTYLVNAGKIDSSHWIQHPEIGGGRIVGEACHFIDLLRYLADSSILQWSSTFLGGPEGAPADTGTITLEFENGCVGVLNYLSNGNRELPKERLEVFAGGRIAVLDNFRRLTPFGWRGAKKKRASRQDKGHEACVAAFLQRVRDGGPPLIPWDQLEEVTRITLETSGARAPVMIE